MSKIENRLFPIQDVESYSYRSDEMGALFDVCVGLPGGYQHKSDKHYPALLVLDGNWTFSIVNAFARYMIGEVKELVVIGVDIPIEEDFVSHSKRRVHQFSPDNDWPMTDPFGLSIKREMDDMSKGWASSESCIGGVPRFYDFLVSELLPDLFKLYRIDNTDIGLAGNSAGGFFAAYKMFTEQSPFRNYIISSPAMALGDGEIFRVEESWAKNHTDLNARVYMGAGLRELHNKSNSLGQIVSGMTKLTDLLLLRNYPSLEIKSDVYEGVGHIDSLSSTIARGLRQLYGRPS